MITWLHSLKKGDLVILVETWGVPRYFIVNVAANRGSFVTISTSEKHFSTETGYLCKDGSYYHAHLVEATPERLEGLKEQRVRNRAINGIRNAKLEQLQTQTLVGISRAIYGSN